MDPESLASTPAGYQTPEQLKQQYELANLLAQNSITPQPITSQWQGWEKIADALSGNYLRNKAAQGQMQNWNIVGGRIGGAEKEGFGEPYSSPYQMYPPSSAGQDSTNYTSPRSTAYASNQPWPSALFSQPPNPVG